MMTASKKAWLDGPTVIFVHVGKTGGTTFKSILRRVYGRERMFETTPNAFPESIQRLARQPAATRDAYRVITGHIPLGLETLIPRRTVTVMLLRDPRERMVSNYFFIRSHAEHPRHKAFLESDIQIEDYLLDQPDNPMTRWLLSTDPFNRRFLRADETVTREHLDRAIKNLETGCDIVGLTERFDDFVALVSARLKWPRLIYCDSNVTHGRPAISDLSHTAQDLLAQKTDLDAQLHAAAQARFERQWGEATRRDRAYSVWLSASGRAASRLRQSLPRR